MGYVPRVPNGVEPYHPVQDFDLRVAVLRVPGNANPVGHAVVQAVVYWRQLSGHLWWTRWGEPSQTAIVDLFLDGGELEWSMDGDQLEAYVAQWVRGQWVEDDEVLGRRVYDATWLSAQESDVVAHRDLDYDLAGMRTGREVARMRSSRFGLASTSRRVS